MASSSQSPVDPETSKPTIQNAVDRLTKSRNLLKDVNMLDSLTKLIAALKDIDQFLLKFGHNNVVGARLETDLERIHILSNNLGTYDGQKFALPAEQLQEEFDSLNEIVSKLMSQSTINLETSKPTIQNVVDRLTESQNLLKDVNMLGSLKKLIAGLKDIEQLMKSGHNTVDEARLKTDLERIHILSNSLGTYDGQKFALPAEQLQEEFDKLNKIVSKLMSKATLQAKSSTNVSEICEGIIPGVVSRLKGANNTHNAGKELKKLTNDLSYIRSFLKNMEDNSKSLSHRVVNFERNATVFVNALIRHSDFEERETDQEFRDKIRVLNKVVMKLKHQISSSNKLSPTDSDAGWYKKVMEEFDYSQVLDILPVLHNHPKFKSSPAFGDFRKVYENLELTTKLCLLCFAAIPGNEVVKKRFMTHWWVGEGFVSPKVKTADDGTLKKQLSVEEVADGIFEELVKKNCIEPVDEKYKYVVDSYKMNPLIRSAVIVLAKEALFFDFDAKSQNLSADCTKSYRACLLDGFIYGDLFKSKIELKSKNDSKKNEGSAHGSDVDERSVHGSDVDETGPGVISNPGPKSKLDAEKVQVIFNVNEPYPDVFELEWFSKLKNVKVLYLGRWQTSAKHHIEVEGTDFLAGLKSMKLLRFLSLQGISRITKLPDSVCKLVNLMILDLRACHNLEAIPSGIGLLKNLTHLDISECYLLDYMPKGISSLSNLRVLKGFVVSHHYSRSNCSLEDLSKLHQLRKLSIYTNSKIFPEDKDVTTLVHFDVLQKLTITWGAGAFPPKADNNAEEERDKKNQGKDVARQTAENSMNPENRGDNRKELDKGAAEPMATTATSSKKAGDNKTQDVGGTQPIAATAKSPEESEDKKRQERDAAQPIAATAKSPEESGDKKRQDRDAVQPIAATAKSPEESEDKNRQDRDAAQPIAATAKSPEESEEKKRQDRDAAQPIAATAKSPEESEEKKRQDRDAAQPIAATAKSPEESEEKKRQDRAAAQPIAATAKSPEKSEEKKRQDRDAAQPITTTTTTTLKNSRHNKNDQEKGVSQPRERSTMNPENVGGNRKQDRFATALASTSDSKPVISRANTLEAPTGPTDGRVFKELQKLDLKCYPSEKPPSWLQPNNLPDLNKLYIRGGTLQNLSSDKWEKVEVLRLKFLSDLKMDYKKLRSSFPSLIYLENFQCPKLTYFPCNENGVIRLKAREIN